MSEDEIDDMANDGRLTQVAMRLAIDGGVDWPSLDGDAQDAWCERAIEHLRSSPAPDARVKARRRHLAARRRAVHAR